MRDISTFEPYRKIEAAMQRKNALRTIADALIGLRQIQPQDRSLVLLLTGKLEHRNNRDALVKWLDPRLDPTAAPDIEALLGDLDRHLWSQKDYWL